MFWPLSKASTSKHNWEASVNSEKVCLVCGDPNGKRHYGATSCNGCKGFFRRSVWEKRTYNCSFNYECIIEFKYRNRCRACRLKRCHQVGMNSNAVRSERNRKSPKTKNKISCSLLEMKSDSLDSECDDECLKILDVKPNILMNSKSQEIIEKIIENEQIVLNREDKIKMNEQIYTMDIPIFEAVEFPTKVCKRTKLNWNNQSRPLITTETLRFNWCRTFTLTVDWFNTLPEINDLDVCDRILLVKLNLMSVGWLWYAYKSYQYKCDGIVFVDGSWYPRDKTIQKSSIGSVCNFYYSRITELFMSEVVNEMNRLKIDETEMILLKILCHLTPDHRLTKQGNKIITNGRNKYKQIICEYVRMKTIGFIEASVRLSQLLQLLPAVENLGRYEDESAMVLSLVESDFNPVDSGGLPFAIHSNIQSMIEQINLNDFSKRKI